MPTCPGCEQTIPYDQLRVHERHCPALHGGDAPDRLDATASDRRLTNMERRIERRLRRLEAEIDAAGGRADRSGVSRSRTGSSDRGQRK